MSTIKISQLPLYPGNLSSSAEFPVVAGGTTYQVSAANISNFVNNSISTLGNLAVTSLSASGTISTPQTIIDGGVSTSGNVIVAGNITAAYLNGNGSALTGIVATSIGTLPSLSVSGNATIGNLLTSGIISSAGTVYAGNLSVTGFEIDNGNITGANFYTAGVVSATGNIRGGNLNSAGSLTATGNIYGGNVLSAGIISAAGEIFAGSLSVTGFIFDNTGNITAGNVLTTGQVSATGNVYGSNLNIGNIFVGGQVSAIGAITGSYLIGNGTQITALTGTNVVGPVALATTALTSGTVTTNAQGNITSVGTLSSLSVSGNTVSGSFIAPGGFFKLPSYTTSQIASLSGMTGGEMVYNSQTQQVQAYQLNPATGSLGWVNWTVAAYQ